MAKEKKQGGGDLLRPGKMVDTRESLAKVYQNGVISGANLKNSTIPRLQTGIFILDFQSGGGVPEGRISNFWGNKSSGKSTLGYRCMGNYLEKYKNRSAILAEFGEERKSLTSDYALNFMSPDELRRVTPIYPDYAEQGIDMIGELIRTEDAGFLMVDCIAAMISLEEAEKSATEDSRAQTAKMANKLIRKILPVLAQRDRLGMCPITVILLNQIRVQQGGKAKGGNIAYHQPGGHRIEHLYHMMVRLYQKEVIQRGGVPIRMCHTYKIEKNKLGLPKCAGEFEMAISEHDGFQVGEVDNYQTVLDYSKKCGVRKKDGASWILDKKKFPNEGACLSYLLENPDAYERVYQATLAECLKNPLFGNSGNDDVEPED